MDNTLLIQINNRKVLKLLQELEKLHLIKVIKKNLSPATKKPSGKYRGIISKEQGDALNEHINKMRNEWNNS